MTLISRTRFLCRVTPRFREWRRRRERYTDYIKSCFLVRCGSYAKILNIEICTDTESAVSFLHRCKLHFSKILKKSFAYMQIRTCSKSHLLFFLSSLRKKKNVERARIGEQSAFFFRKKKLGQHKYFFPLLEEESADEHH